MPTHPNTEFWPRGSRGLIRIPLRSKCILQWLEGRGFSPAARAPSKPLRVSRPAQSVAERRAGRETKKEIRVPTDRGAEASPFRVLGKKSRSVVLVLLCALAGSLAAHGQKPAQAPPSVEAYVRQFEASYREVRSLRADFTQTYVMGGRTRIESGVVFFARGGLMRWDYKRPSEKLFLSDGKYVLLYIPAEKQLTRSPVKSSEDFRVPFRLLLTRLNLRRVFARFEFADEVNHDPGDRVLRAYPKKEYAGDYQDVLIELSARFDVRRLVVDYADHSRMEFRFDHIERNPALVRSLFQFSPPRGTEIIDQH
jgi:chaperone LolA